MSTEQFRQWMQQRRLSVSNAAALFGMSLHTVSSWHSGRCCLPRHVAVTISAIDALGPAAEEFIQRRLGTKKPAV